MIANLEMSEDGCIIRYIESELVGLLGFMAYQPL